MCNFIHIIKHIYFESLGCTKKNKHIGIGERVKTCCYNVSRLRFILRRKYLLRKKNTHLAFKIEGKDREIIFLIIIA